MHYSTSHAAAAAVREEEEEEEVGSRGLLLILIQLAHCNARRRTQEGGNER